MSTIDFLKVEEKTNYLKDLKKAEQEKIDNSFIEERHNIEIIETELDCLYEYQRYLMNYFLLKEDYEQLLSKIKKAKKAKEDSAELEKQLVEFAEQIKVEENKLTNYALEFFPIFNKYLEYGIKIIMDVSKTNRHLPSILKNLGKGIQITMPFLLGGSTLIYNPELKLNAYKEQAIANLKTIRECILRKKDSAYEDLNKKINDISGPLHNISNALGLLDKLNIMAKQKQLVDNLGQLKDILN